MAFQLTDAQDLEELMGKLKTFAVSLGFKVIGDGDFTSANPNSAGEKYLILKKKKPIFYFRDGSSEEYDQKISGGKIKDRTMNLGLAVGTDYASVAYAEINDLAGPFKNVWFFGDENDESVWVVVENGPERFTHFGFGLIDQEGMTTPSCGFMAGMRYIFWEDRTEPIYLKCNDLTDYNHDFYFKDNTYLQVYIPDGVMDKDYFPGDYPRVITQLTVVFDPEIDRTSYFSGGSNGQKIMNYYGLISNFNTTGGIPLLSVPILSNANNFNYWFGRYPNMRFVNVSNLAPGEVVKYQNDEWLCFPLKQKGLERNSARGVNPSPAPNTLHYGVAFKRNG